MSVDSGDAPVIESARRKRTRDRLIDAAYEVFAEYGIATATVEQIAERAGFTRGAFYSNFESKEELFFALADRENQVRFDRLEAGLTEYLPENGRISTDQISSIVRDFLGLQPDNRSWCLMQSEFQMLALRDPEVGKTYIAGEERAMTMLGDRLDELVAMVGLRFTMNSRELSTVLGAIYSDGIARVMLAGSTNPGPDTVDAVSDTIARIVQAFTEPV
ncbi:TetR/AcrR family transcriptional regulator [Mycetocola tolaasinivorans]|uniref:TetR/AcrR family transcriptional regulator n=1 Tax=Mycetocola tolaasinivorans TaxID=76635 RepID=A0A3L7A2K5_9MICO|nr:TetR/AcrR family transcriptional regulator [Mycetocola tolaasinivorans]RLP74543.1 TetR/AcrR family transcriptional regulator [Mycetocola tolaasinivorans]